MENNNNPFWEKVSFAFSYATVEEALMADSSHVARSLYDVAAEKPSVASYIITEDDKSFVVGHVRVACADIATRLVAYLAEDARFQDEPYTFVLNLPSGRNAAIDSLIRHELLRAIVAYVLMQWYEVRLPDVAARQRQLYDAAVAMVRHDVFMARGRVHRAGSYF